MMTTNPAITTAASNRLLRAPPSPAARWPGGGWPARSPARDPSLRGGQLSLLRAVQSRFEAPVDAYYRRHTSIDCALIPSLRAIYDRSPGRTRSLIQLDAAISPGNSGGALIDAAGRVIAINKALHRQPCLGFAMIPAATAEQLLADSAATHPYRGLSPSRLTQGSARTRLVADACTLVLAVAPGGPAPAADV